MLIDFGSALEWTGGRITPADRLVTPGFAPLEQYASQAKLAPYTDLYALGATLFYLLTGDPPPDALSRTKGTPLPQMPGNTPDKLRISILSLLEVDVKRRPQSADAFLRTLGASSAPETPSTPHPVPPKAAPTGKNFAWVWVVGLTLLGRVIFGGGQPFQTQNQAQVTPPTPEIQPAVDPVTPEATPPWDSAVPPAPEETEWKGDNATDNADPKGIEANPQTQEVNTGLPESIPPQQEPETFPSTPEPSQPEPAVAPPVQHTTLPPQVKHTDTFTLGDSQEQVLSVMGTPDTQADNFWMYGLSSVHFEGGVVSGWSNSSGNLKVILEPHQTSKATHFTYGDPQDVVLSVMGTPSVVGGSFWMYGLSSVDFEGGVVSRWSNSSGNLRVQ